MADPCPYPVTDPETLYARFRELGLGFTVHEHAAVFTVEEARAHRGDMPGAHCKNLFLKDKKGALWLVVCLEDRRIDMKALSGLLGAARLSFGQPELLARRLGVTPGSVTPFAVIPIRKMTDLHSPRPSVASRRNDDGEDGTDKIDN